MHVVEGLVRDRELDVGEVALDEVHVAPRDDLLGKLLAKRVRNAQRQPLDAGGKRAQDAADAHLGAKEAQLRGVGVRELEVVNAHHAHAAGINNLLVENVACEKDLVGLKVGEADVGGDDLKVHLVLVVGVDVLAPADHERGVAGAHERKAGDAGKDFASGDAQVRNGAYLLAVEVENRVSQELGEVDHACSFSAGVYPGKATHTAYVVERHPMRRAANSTPEGSSTVRSGFHGSLSL